MKQQAFFSWSKPLLGMSAAAALVGAGSAVHVPIAHACGGFFCSQAQPVDQSAEEIIFLDNPDETVTAVIRINYQGPSEHFAWVLPIEGKPTKVDVSSNAAFDNLRNGTNPQYTLTTTVDGTCKQEMYPQGVGFGAPTASNAGAAGGTADKSITVVDSGTVGPYDWEVIMVDPTLTDAADAAVTWLTGHGYDVTDLGPGVLRPYLADGLNLMAFKLTKGAGADTGSIRPVIITFNSKLPVIPIRPTAVAAQPDMGILVYLLSDHQGIPKNYKSLVLNEALINWLPNYGYYGGGPISVGGGGFYGNSPNYPSNYRDVVTAAAGEAGGQGFVTEMAGDSKALDKLIFSDNEQQQWMNYSMQTFADGYDAIMGAPFEYHNWDGWKDTVCGAVTLPAGLTCETFARDPSTYRSMVQIDGTKFLKTLYETVVKPVMATQDLLLSRPYFTRMFTTMSPEDMTVDPLFDFNPDLADVSNIHMAKQVIECSASVAQSEAPWRIELPQGGVIRGKGTANGWPIAIDGTLPANLKVVELGTSGGGKIAEDNSSMILKALTKQSGMTSMGSAGSSGGSTGTNTLGTGGSGGSGTKVPIGGVTPGAGNGTTTGTPGSSPSSSGGCSVATTGTSQSGWFSLAMIGLALGAVRRRRAR